MMTKKLTGLQIGAEEIGAEEIGAEEISEKDAESIRRYSEKVKALKVKYGVQIGVGAG